MGRAGCVRERKAELVSETKRWVGQAALERGRLS